MQDARDAKGSAKGREGEPVEVRCPTCGVVVHVPRDAAERDMKAHCPSGHEIVLFRAI